MSFKKMVDTTYLKNIMNQRYCMNYSMTISKKRV